MHKHGCVARFGWGKAENLEIRREGGLCGFGCGTTLRQDDAKQIEELKAQCLHRVVSIHGGEEGAGRETKAQRDYARAAVRAGASLVLGHHSHVVGGIEVYQGATIVYSLGNFCFGGNTNPADKDTFIFQQRFELGADGRSGGGLVIPCSVTGKQGKKRLPPVPLTGSAAERVLGRIERLSNASSERGPGRVAGEAERGDGTAGGSGPGFYKPPPERATGPPNPLSANALNQNPNSAWR